MTRQTSKEDKNVLQEPYDFSLVLGGPLYQLLRRSRLTDDALDHVRRRILIITGFVWLPLLIFSVLQGLAWSGVKLPFLYDFDSHCRFLVALPLLIYAELVVHVRMRSIVHQFIDRDLIPQSQRERFFAIVQSAVKLRNSIAVEILLIVFVYAVGVNYIWRNYMSVQGGETWYVSSVPGGGTSFAKLWYVYVSLPIFQFILLRWYFRQFIWTRFLWQVSRLDLRLVPTHPDLSGGLGFLAATVYAFIPILLAHSVLFAGSIANWIFYEGGKLLQYRLEIIAVVAAAVFFVLGPLLVFTGRLSSARRTGLREYGTFAQRYVREFDNKWLRSGDPGEPLMGSADIQSLADLNNSFDVIRSMNIVPFTKHTIFQLAVFTLLPFLPLMLTMISMEELVDRILKSVF